MIQIESKANVVDLFNPASFNKIRARRQSVKSKSGRVLSRDGLACSAVVDNFRDCCASPVVDDSQSCRMCSTVDAVSDARVCGVLPSVEHFACFYFAANESRACSTIEAVSHEGVCGVSPSARVLLLQPMTCRGQVHSGANTSAFRDVVRRRLHTHGQRGVAKHRCGRWSIVAARQFTGNVAVLSSMHWRRMQLRRRETSQKIVFR